MKYDLMIMFTLFSSTYLDIYVWTCLGSLLPSYYCYSLQSLPSIFTCFLHLGLNCFPYSLPRSTGYILWYSYCDCFAAGLYCIEPCSCQDCFNKPIHENVVLETRRQIESRNPLAFAPKVIRSKDSILDSGVRFCFYD